MASSLVPISPYLDIDGRTLVVPIGGIGTGPLSPAQPSGMTAAVNGASVSPLLTTAGASSVALYLPAFVPPGATVTLTINGSNLADASGNTAPNAANVPAANNSAGTGATYTQAVGNPPPVTSAAYDAWSVKWLNYRLNECPVPRAASYYFALSGDDSAGAGTLASPFKSVAKANAVLAASAGNIALLFKGEARPKETVTVAAPVLAATTTSVSIDARLYPNGPLLGSTATLTGGGATEAATVSFVFTSGPLLVIQFSGAVAATHTGVSFGALAYLNVIRPNVTIATWPAGSGGSGQKVIFSAFESPISVNACYGNGAAQRGGTGATGWTLTVTGGVITACTGGAGGTGFDPNSPPIVTAPGGSGALLKAAVNGTGQVTGVSVIYGGTGYTSGAAVTVQGDSYARAFMFYQAKPSPLAAFRDQGDTVKVFRIMNSLAQVDATPGSWWQNPATGFFYYHLHGNRPALELGDLNEFLFANASSFLVIADVHGTRVDNIRVDGYGANLVDDAMRPYGIKGTISGANGCVVSNCEVYYNGYHAIGILGSGRGGNATYYRNKVGLGTRGGDYVTYAPQGGHESLVWECESNCVGLPRGFVPNTNSYGAGGAMISHAGGAALVSPPAAGSTTIVHSPGFFVLRAGQSITLSGGTSETVAVSAYDPNTYTITLAAPVANAGHTGISDPLCFHPAIFLAKGCETKYLGQWQSAPFGMPSSGQPYWTDIADCRTWAIGEKFSPRAPTALDANPITYAVTSQTINTITVPATSVSGEATVWPIQSQWVRLGGGASPSEMARVQGVNTGTGVIALYGAVTGQGRIEATWDIGLVAAGGDMFVFNPTPNTIYRDCHYEVRQMIASDARPHQFMGGGSNTVFLNSTLVLDASQPPAFLNTGPVARFFNTTQASGQIELYNCRCHVRLSLKSPAVMDDRAAGGSPSLNKVFNSILSADNAAGGWAPGVGNGGGAQQANNAYLEATTKTGAGGYDQDPSYVELGAMNLTGHPETGSPLLSASPAAVRGYRLEVDAEGRPRPLTGSARGPVEPLSSPAAAAPSPFRGQIRRGR